MHQVQASSIIEAAIEQVWKLIRNFSAILEWLPGVRSCVIKNWIRSDQIEAICHIDMNDGDMYREQLSGLLTSITVSTSTSSEALFQYPTTRR